MSFLPNSPSVRLLQQFDLPLATELTCVAGWNQLAEDWARLLAIEPAGCFAIECAGRLAATATVVCYSRELAWIGMVLTSPQFRRRGFAALLMDRALEFTRQRRVATVKLDATEAGIELYRKLGFEDECPVERWRRGPSSIEKTDALPYAPDPAYDRERFGADRSRLLADLAECQAASLADGSFAMGRPGALAAYFGPCVASSASSARILLRWFLASHNAEPVFWDLLPENHSAVQIAQEFGFVPARRLTRMVLAGRNLCRGAKHSGVYAIAGFEFG